MTIYVRAQKNSISTEDDISYVTVVLRVQNSFLYVVLLRFKADAMNEGIR